MLLHDSTCGLVGFGIGLSGHGSNPWLLGYIRNGLNGIIPADTPKRLDNISITIKLSVNDLDTV